METRNNQLKWYRLGFLNVSWCVCMFVCACVCVCICMHVCVREWVSRKESDGGLEGNLLAHRTCGGSRKARAEKEKNSVVRFIVYSKLVDQLDLI